MQRIRAVTFDNLVIKIGSMTFDETEEYMRVLKEMINRDPKPTADDWKRRQLETVATALQKGSNGSEEKWDPARVTHEFDTPTINFLYEQIVAMTGLNFQLPKSGEGQATSISS